MTALLQSGPARPTPTVRILRHTVRPFLCALLAFGVAPSAPAAPPEKAAASWDDAKRMSIDELARLLKDPAAAKPEMLHVGFRVLYVQAHIPGSRFAGPGASPAGLEALRKAVAAVPKTKTVVLYCGCCPWERCPNMEQPWRLLVAAGFTDVRVLYIPTNFGRDWVGKGHPSASGSGERG